MLEMNWMFAYLLGALYSGYPKVLEFHGYQVVFLFALYSLGYWSRRITFDHFVDILAHYTPVSQAPAHHG
jgi:hypothetical protein